jgi:hypothetical protein
MEAAWSAGRDFYMPMGHADDSVDTDDLVQASTESAIPASNRGYALLQRLGWKEGKGLGRNEDGGSLTSLAMCVACCGDGDPTASDVMRVGRASVCMPPHVGAAGTAKLARMLRGWAPSPLPEARAAAYTRARTGAD